MRASLGALLVGWLLTVAVAPALGAERWGWFGIRIRDLTERETEDLAIKLGLREGYGVLIAEIIKDSPAQASELREGDLIVTIDGRPVVETRALQRIVGGTPAGREVKVVVVREGTRRDLSVRVGDMPGEMVAERVAAEFGFAVRGQAAEDATTGAAPGAPVVSGVAEGSPAARGGLAAGDRVVAVNGASVTSLEAFRRRVQDLLLKDEMRLAVERKGEPRVLVLPPVRPASPPE